MIPTNEEGLERISGRSEKEINWLVFSLKGQHDIGLDRQDGPWNQICDVVNSEVLSPRDKGSAGLKYVSKT